MDQDSTLYHYCSSSTFSSIVDGRSIWLSSLTLSNDSMEGRLVRETLLRIAERDGLNASYRERLQESLSYTERMFEGLGFCLSEEADLLSQWRGYADDARGVAIGFSKAYLLELASSLRGGDQPSFSLLKVEYDVRKHEEAIESTYRELRNLIDLGAFRRSGQLSLLDSRTPEQVADDDKATANLFMKLLYTLVSLFPKLYELKANGFREEREWRLVSILIGLGDAPPDKCLFRSTPDRVIPYRLYALPETATPAIREVVVGPRHATPPHLLQRMLQQAGFGTVPIRNSSVSYR